MPSCSAERLDALAVRNRHCLGGYKADTFKITVLLTVHCGPVDVARSLPAA